MSVLVNEDMKPAFLHSPKLLRIPKIEQQEEALALISKVSKVIMESDESTSPTSTTEHCSNRQIPKEQKMIPPQSFRKVPLNGKQKLTKTNHKNEICKKSTHNKGEYTANRAMVLGISSSAQSSLTKASGKMSRICEEMEKIGEASASKLNNEELHPGAILVPLPIIHEEFRCRSENCPFRTSIRQELIQHIIIEHDE